MAQGNIMNYEKIVPSLPHHMTMQHLGAVASRLALSDSGQFLARMATMMKLQQGFHERTTLQTKTTKAPYISDRPNSCCHALSIALQNGAV